MMHAYGPAKCGPRGTYCFATGSSPSPMSAMWCYELIPRCDNSYFARRCCAEHRAWGQIKRLWFRLLTDTHFYLFFKWRFLCSSPWTLGTSSCWDNFMDYIEQKMISVGVHGALDLNLYRILDGCFGTQTLLLNVNIKWHFIASVIMLPSQEIHIWL
jgi:hypothetical protein